MTAPGTLACEACALDSGTRDLDATPGGQCPADGRTYHVWRFAPSPILESTPEVHTVHTMTHRDIIRAYSDGITSGAYDRDITDARARWYLARLLNLASNHDTAGCTAYGAITDRDRAAMAQYLGRIVWDARAIVPDRDIARFDSAHARAVDIIRNA